MVATYVSIVLKDISLFARLLHVHEQDTVGAGHPQKCQLISPLRYVLCEMPLLYVYLTGGGITGLIEYYDDQ